MKIINAYTIMHTGGTFLCNLFVENFTKESFVWHGDAYCKQMGRAYVLDEYQDKIDVITEEWFISQTIEYFEEEYKQKDVVLYSHHFKNPTGPFVTSLKNNKPEIKIVSSLRDPLLIINTFIWWDFAYNGTLLNDMEDIVRFRRADNTAKAVNSLLDVPPENMFILPVDLLATKDDKTKYETVKQMFDFCEIDISESGIDNILGWKKRNNTSGSWHLKQQNGVESFKKHKQLLESKNRDKIQRSMSIEFDRLNSDKELTEKLIKLGYDPIWKG